MAPTAVVVSRKEKAAGVVVVLVEACSVETMLLLREMAREPGNEFTFCETVERKESLVSIKTYDPGTIELLVGLADEVGNEFVFPEVRTERAREAVIVLGDPLAIIAAPPPRFGPHGMKAPHTNPRRRNSADESVGGTSRKVRHDRRNQFPGAAPFAFAR